MYPDYLVHFNKLHSKKNGQFVSGDGDGDGTGDEHHRYTKSGYSAKSSHPTQSHQSQSPPQQQVVNSQQLKLVGGLGKWAAGKAFCATKFGKPFKDGSMNAIGKMFVQSTGLDKIAKDMKLKESIADAKNKAYDKAANRINKTYNNGGLTATEKQKLKVAGIATGAAVAVGGAAYGIKKLGGKINDKRMADYKLKLREAEKEKIKNQRSNPERSFFNAASSVINTRSSAGHPKEKQKTKYRVRRNQYLPR